jgi:hypothetical protein
MGTDFDGAAGRAAGVAGFGAGPTGGAKGAFAFGGTTTGEASGLAAAGAAGRAGLSETGRKWNTVAHNGQVSATAPFTAAGGKKCLQVGLGQGKPVLIAETSRKGFISLSGFAGGTQATFGCALFPSRAGSSSGGSVCLPRPLTPLEDSLRVRLRKRRDGVCYPAIGIGWFPLRHVQLL